MKLLLCKNIEKLGIVGDVVNVAPGYARNYLLPQGLATEPTEANMKSLAEARKIAEQERAQRLEELRALAERLADVEVMIRARANEQGHLYGSVGPREISASLQEEGYDITPEQIILPDPIRQLENNLEVEAKCGETRTSFKVWVVREKVEGEDDFDDEMEGGEASAGENAEGSAEGSAVATESGTEAGEDGKDTSS
ncbi:MAG: 50S ribosomal protein L9 [Phycisphaerae bacterium]